MIADVQAPPKAEPRAIAVPTLRTAGFDDYERIRALVSAHGFEFPAVEEWLGLWQENPLRTRLRTFPPLGWVLETAAGEIVGTMGTAWAPYTFRGEGLISAMGRAWFVAEPYRGFALRLMAEYFSQPVDLFINNTVSVAAVGSFSRLSAPVPVGTWDSFSYWVTQYHGFARRVLQRAHIPYSSLFAHPAGAALALKDAAFNKRFPRRNGSFTVDTCDRFDSRFDEFWKELVRQNPEKLLAVRDVPTLSWHFAIPMRKGRLWIFTASRNGKLRAYCTFTRQDHGFRLPAFPRGDTQGLRGMRLVDYQSIEPETDFLPALLEGALQRCACEDFYILESMGRGVPKMRAFDEFAPYRRKLENWKFFYTAADPALDEELRQAKFWDPSAYDADAALD